MTESQRVRLSTKPDRPGSPSPLMPDARPPTAPASFHVLAKPTGPICNLDCEYCFFLSKESLYPNDRFRMPDDMLKQYVRQVIESQAAPEVTIAWQGGEPTLMGLGFFQRAVALVEEFRRPDQTVHHTIQTNGTLLTDEWCAFLAEAGFLVGISIDGPSDLHDRYRVDKRGQPTFEKVKRGLDLLVAHNVEWNVLCTVNAANQDHPLEGQVGRGRSWLCLASVADVGRREIRRPADFADPDCGVGVVALLVWLLRHGESVFERTFPGGQLEVLDPVRILRLAVRRAQTVIVAPTNSTLKASHHTSAV